MTDGFDNGEPERTIEAVYRKVATAPNGTLPLKTGRTLTERLGYPAADLARIPSEAIEAFAGVGYHHDLAAISPGDRVLDLGSGSGTDAFLAALRAGPAGRVTGVDVTSEQVTNARRWRERGGFETVAFERGAVEALPYADDAFDVVLSNGTIPLSTRTERALREAHRVVRRDGRLACTEVVAGVRLPERIRADAELWAAGIAGAMHEPSYLDAIEAAGFEVIVLRTNEQNEFHTDRAREAGRTYGLRSISLSARKRD